MEIRKPNFLYIGPDKSGSTWIYEVLKSHPEVYMSPAKELFYFDYYYDRGFDWYLKHFKQASEEYKVVGEVSHDYLFSLKACKRIKRELPNVKLMVCLRDPVERAFSSYLFMIRQGRVNMPFEKALQILPELVDHGMYAKHLVPYLHTFGKNAIHVAIFDDLKANPEGFSKALYQFLGIRDVPLPEEFLSPVLVSSRPRSMFFAKITKRLALAVRDAGFPVIVSCVKKLSLLQNILYQEYQPNRKPTLSAKTREMLIDIFKYDVQHLESLLGLNLMELWVYAKDSDISSLESPEYNFNDL